MLVARGCQLLLELIAWKTAFCLLSAEFAASRLPDAFNIVVSNFWPTIACNSFVSFKLP